MIHSGVCVCAEATNKSNTLQHKRIYYGNCVRYPLSSEIKHTSDAAPIRFPDRVLFFSSQPVSLGLIINRDCIHPKRTKLSFFHYRNNSRYIKESFATCSAAVTKQPIDVERWIDATHWALPDHRADIQY